VAFAIPAGNRRQHRPAVNNPHTIGDKPPELPAKRDRSSKCRPALPIGHPFTGIYRRQSTSTGSSRTGNATNNTGNLARPPPTHRRYAEHTGVRGIYKGVSLCVVLCLLWVGDNKFLREKKTAKKEACRQRVLVIVVDKPRMRCVRSNVCATGASPHCSLFVRVGSR